LVFSKDILYHNNFVINTEENFGFCIARDGIVAKSQFSGEEGMTITNLYNIKFLKRYNFNPYCSEILILDNVNLDKLQCIYYINGLNKPLNDKLMNECNDKNIRLYSIV
jgi:hypothetical protein